MTICAKKNSASARKMWSTGARRAQCMIVPRTQKSLFVCLIDMLSGPNIDNRECKNSFACLTLALSLSRCSYELRHQKILVLRIVEGQAMYMRNRVVAY
jgi:hypothetical protein